MKYFLLAVIAVVYVAVMSCLIAICIHAIVNNNHKHVPILIGVTVLVGMSQVLMIIQVLEMYP